MSRETAEGSITGKRKLLIIHEAMGGCGRNVIDIVNGVDSSKFEVTKAGSMTLIIDCTKFGTVLATAYTPLAVLLAKMLASSRSNVPRRT